MSKAIVLVLALALAFGLVSSLTPQAGDDPWVTVPAEVQASALRAAADVVLYSHQGEAERADVATLEKEVGVVAYQIVWSYLKQRGVQQRGG